MIINQGIITKYLDEQYARGNSINTIDYYKYCLLKYTEYQDKFKIKHIDKDVLINYLIYLRNDDNINSVSVQSYIRGLKAILRWLYDEEYTNIDYSIKLKLPKADKQIINPLTDEEIKVLLKSAGTGRNELIIMLMLDSGLRFTEVLNLKTEQINIRNKYIIVTGKGNKQRIVPISERTVELIKDKIYTDKDDYIISKADHQKLTTNGLKSLFRKLKKKTGIKRLHPHLLRHTFATRYLENGGSIYYLKEILGHTSLKMTMNYLHIAKTRIQQDFELYSTVNNIK